MSIPVEHTIKLIDVNDPSKPYKFIVRCSCQWEGLAHTRQVAERWIASHAWGQNLRGNPVVIDRGTLGDFVPSADPVGPEQPIVADAVKVVPEEVTGYSPTYPDLQADAIAKLGKRN